MLQTMFKNRHAGYLLVILSAVSVTLTSSILALMQNIDLAVPEAEHKEGHAYCEPAASHLAMMSCSLPLVRSVRRRRLSIFSPNEAQWSHRDDGQRDCPLLSD